MLQPPLCSLVRARNQAGQETGLGSVSNNHHLVPQRLGDPPSCDAGCLILGALSGGVAVPGSHSLALMLCSIHLKARPFPWLRAHPAPGRAHGTLQGRQREGFVGRLRGGSAESSQMWGQARRGRERRGETWTRLGAKCSPGVKQSSSTPAVPVCTRGRFVPESAQEARTHWPRHPALAWRGTFPS